MRSMRRRGAKSCYFRFLPTRWNMFANFYEMKSNATRLFQPIIIASLQ